MTLDNPILMARIGAPHGIKGEVRVKSFTDDPLALGDYGSLYSPVGEKFKITRLRPQKGVVVVKFKGVNTRNEAEQLNGTELFIDRSALPDDVDEDEFYITDLIGCDAKTADGTKVGSIIAVPDFGAGPLLEISPSSGASPDGAASWYLEFTLKNVPNIDLDAREITIVMPPQVSERDG